MLSARLPKTIMIVDDDSVAASTLAAIFAGHGCGVRTFSSAESALEPQGTWTPEIAIVDACLPGMQGLDLVALLKSTLPACRTLLISASITTPQALEAHTEAATPDAVLAKPIAPALWAELLREQGHITASIACLDPIPFHEVSVEEMAFALSLFMGVARLQAATLRESLTDGQACAQLFGMICYNRLHRSYGGDIKRQMDLYAIFRTLWHAFHGHTHRRAICARALVFHLMMERVPAEFFAQWTTPTDGDPESVDMHPAVISAMATAPVNEAWLISEHRFAEHLGTFIADQPAKIS